MNSFIAAWITLAIGTIAICFCFFIMRKKTLRWTQMPPTECGWWWVRDKGSIEIAEIALSGNVQNAGDFLVVLCNDNSYKLLSDMARDGCEWAGPIEIPGG